MLVSGAYTLRVSEGSGNTISRVFNIEIESNLGLDLIVLSDYGGFPVSCEEANNATLRAIGLNSDGNFSYEWTLNDVLVGMDPTLMGAGVGTYKATVFDGAGCMLSEEVELTAPPAIELQADVTDISCPGNADGEVFVSVTGGVTNGPYNFQWSNNRSGQRISLLEEGTYGVTATDNNGCFCYWILYISRTRFPKSGIGKSSRLRTHR